MLTYAALALTLLTSSPDPELVDPDKGETQALLYEVEDELRVEAGPWSEAQLASRLELLDQLHAYAAAGVFPHNHTHDHEVPVFVDEHGTHCAVAYLIRASGHGALAQAIAREDNHIRLPEDEPRIAAWAAEHGFSVDELSRIQRPGYRPRPPMAEKPKSKRPGRPDQVGGQVALGSTELESIARPSLGLGLGAVKVTRPKAR